MAVDWFEGETDMSVMTDCMVGAGILRRMVDQKGEKLYIAQLPNQPWGTPLPHIAKRGRPEITVWMISKLLMDVGHSQEDAMLIAHRGWLGVPIPPYQGYFSPQRARYYISRVTNAPKVPDHTLALWSQYLTTWRYHLQINQNTGR